MKFIGHWLWSNRNPLQMKCFLWYSNKGMFNVRHHEIFIYSFQYTKASNCNSKLLMVTELPSEHHTHKWINICVHTARCVHCFIARIDEVFFNCLLMYSKSHRIFALVHECYTNIKGQIVEQITNIGVPSSVMWAIAVGFS